MSESRQFNMQAASAASDVPATSGRVVHDDRGTAVWDWDVTTAVLAEKTVEELITTLDEPGVLSLEDAANDWSGDPYNRPAR